MKLCHFTGLMGTSRNTLNFIIILLNIFKFKQKCFKSANYFMKISHYLFIFSPLQFIPLEVSLPLVNFSNLFSYVNFGFF